MTLPLIQGPVVQSIVSLTGSLRVILLTVLADSIYNILIFFAEKMWVASAHFFSKKFQHICVSLDVNFNESLTNDIISFEQLGPEFSDTSLGSHMGSFNTYLALGKFSRQLIDDMFSYFFLKIGFEKNEKKKKNFKMLSAENFTQHA